GGEEADGAAGDVDVVGSVGLGGVVSVSPAGCEPHEARDIRTARAAATWPVRRCGHRPVANGPGRWRRWPCWSCVAAPPSHASPAASGGYRYPLVPYAPR